MLVILLRRACGLEADTDELRVVPRSLLDFQRKRSLTQRVKLARRAASDFGHDGIAIVHDSEGHSPKSKRMEMEAGRDTERSSFPTVIGLAVPCLEAWLSADGTAIKRGLRLNERPTVPERPEEFRTGKAPGPHYKRHLAQLAGAAKKDLSAIEKSKIAELIDLTSLVEHCPSFQAFADEIADRLAPLFARHFPNPETAPDKVPDATASS